MRLLALFCLLTASRAIADATPSPRCAAPEPAAAKVEEARAEAVQSPLYGFAAKTFGPPASCDGTFRLTPDGRSSRLTFHFADGSSLTFEVSPPETVVETLRSKAPLPDVARAKAALQAEAKYSNGTIDWGGKPEERRKRGAETTTRTYWDPDPDFHLGVDLVYRGRELVGLRFHLAL